jgi:hypothetical protein
VGIKGAEGLNDREIEALIAGGARVVVFSYCISVIIITFRRSATVLVRSGSSTLAAGMPYTLISLFFGWWGFPFGLIFTPIALVQNLGGGKDVTGQLRAAVNTSPRAPGLPAPGRQVVVPWSNGQLYTGTVLEARGDRVYVRFANGHEEWVPNQHVRAAP